MRFALLRSAIVLSSIGLSAAAAWALPPGVLFSEDFEDGVANGLTVRGGAYGIGSGIGSSKGFAGLDFHNVMTLDGIPSDHVAVDVDFQINEGTDGDFDTWVNATFDPLDGVYPAPGYVAMVNPAGSDNPLATLKRNGPIPGQSDETLLDQTVNTIGAGEPHHLRVERFGADINVLLDGNLILSATDSTYAGGEVAFRMFRSGIVDNIVVSVPEPTAAIGLIGAMVLLRRRK